MSFINLDTLEPWQKLAQLDQKIREILGDSARYQNQLEKYFNGLVEDVTTQVVRESQKIAAQQEGKILSRIATEKTHEFLGVLVALLGDKVSLEKDALKEDALLDLEMNYRKIQRLVNEMVPADKNQRDPQTRDLASRLEKVGLAIQALTLQLLQTPRAEVRLAPVRKEKKIASPMQAEILRTGFSKEQAEVLAEVIQGLQKAATRSEMRRVLLKGAVDIGEIAGVAGGNLLDRFDKGLIEFRGPGEAGEELKPWHDGFARRTATGEAQIVINEHKLFNGYIQAPSDIRIQKADMDHLLHTLMDARVVLGHEDSHREDKDWEDRLTDEIDANQAEIGIMEKIDPVRYENQIELRKALIAIAKAKPGQGVDPGAIDLAQEILIGVTPAHAAIETLVSKMKSRVIAVKDIQNHFSQIPGIDKARNLQEVKEWTARLPKEMSADNVVFMISNQDSEALREAPALWSRGYGVVIYDPENRTYASDEISMLRKIIAWMGRKQFEEKLRWWIPEFGRPSSGYPVEQLLALSEIAALIGELTRRAVLTTSA